jgi:hypothetical protein
MMLKQPLDGCLIRMFRVVLETQQAVINLRPRFYHRKVTVTAFGAETDIRRWQCREKTHQRIRILRALVMKSHDIREIN